MFNSTNRKIFVGLAVGALLSTAASLSLAASYNEGDKDTYRLVDTEGNPVLSTRYNECIETPVTPNEPARFFKECGDVMEKLICSASCPASAGEPGPNDLDEKGCPKDEDGDGVADYCDKCPNTPADCKVDEFGCPLDTDQDGVIDCRDLCPGTPIGETVDKNGCGAADVKQVVEENLSSDVLFDFDKFTLKPAARVTLDKIAEGIINDGDYVRDVTVIGHTDSVGSDSYNQRLSEKRAKSVADYLLSRGVASDKLAQYGKGEKEPIASNSTSVGRSKNRRVVIEIKLYREREVPKSLMFMTD
jgi:OOP family OmpA-OmpF porin